LSIFEILIVAAIALIVIGPDQLPEVLQIVGKLLRDLRLASNTMMRELTSSLEEPPAAIAPRLPEPESNANRGGRRDTRSLEEPPVAIDVLTAGPKDGGQRGGPGKTTGQG
jgi:Sec-independent protein translocase protein TatA